MQTGRIPNPPGIVARASNFVAMGDMHNFAQHLISYMCFVVGACSGGMVINYETFYLVRCCFWQSNPSPIRCNSDATWL